MKTGWYWIYIAEWNIVFVDSCGQISRYPPGLTEVVRCVG